MKKIFKNYMEFVIFLNFVAFFAIRDIKIFFWLSQGLFFISTIIYCKGKKISFRYILYYSAYLLWILLSFFWAESTSYALKFLRENAQVFLVCSCLSIYCTDLDKIKRVIYILMLSLFVTAGYLFIKTPLSEWKYIYYFDGAISSSDGRLGRTIGVHPNHMGYICRTALLLSFYYISVKDKNKKSAIVLFAIFTILLFFTKSRASILSTAVSLSIFWIIEEERQRKSIIKLLSMVVIVLVLFWAIFNVDFLYNLVGFRFQGLLGIFDSSSKVDLSYSGREMLITTGIKIIKNYPLFGVGAGNYAYIAYTKYGIWREVYSHSNFIEIFANLGLIGFIIYYYPRILCTIKLKKLLKNSCEENRKLIALLFSFIFTSIIFDIMKMTYNDEAYQLFIVICFAVAFLKNEYQNKNE